jgi:DNA-directed RNA polymerase specialized sigma24 family protein
MGREGLQGVLGYLRNLGSPHVISNRTDGQLLSDYCAENNQAAFAELVRRHASLVLSVCQRVLPRVVDIEDAFQATFLALARDAATLRRRDSIAGWLHGVARHIALDARRAATRRNRYENQVTMMPAKNPAWEAAWR